MISAKRIRIGTRESALALFQAKAVKAKLHQLGIESEIIEIISDGDVDLVTPLYEMGIQGIFTKSLDAALLQNKIDIAVHSCKDIPTKLAKGLSINAILERSSPFDCLVLPKAKNTIAFDNECVIATSSLRRKSQWLHRYPHHTTENLRGNIQTRLKKLDEANWDGALFAQAALDRLGVSSHHYITLDWMLPAPAQGAIAVVGREGDHAVEKMSVLINHEPTKWCVSVERDFLAALQGGCAVPIAAHAVIQNNQLLFKGNIFSLDAKEKCQVELSFDTSLASEAGLVAAKEILKQGGERIVKTFRPSF